MADTSVNRPSFIALSRRPWFWAWVASAAAYGATLLLIDGGGGIDLIQAALTFAAFSAIVGIGQMFVITLGPGNVDLSIPATMTLAATLSLKFMGGSAGLILPGLVVAVGVGFSAGVANYLLIRMLRIPPIIATLSASFLYQSLAIWSNRGLRIKPPQALSDFTTGTLLGVPNVALVGLAVALAAWVLLERSTFGRWISAFGQNERAARLSGVPVEMVRALTFIGSAVLAGFTGYLLASFSGGAALNMGTEYLLISIAVVVIGGCSIAGGYSNVPGIWGGALFMFLIVSMLNSYGLGAGFRLMITGAIIIGIVAAASGRDPQ
ncbi:monosaccharide ABC transporter membrane protein, CUT2 family [Palleronia marisminoris]|uniref:Autoinducer 2 import system permease protein LsrD n=1 Tax=Palleronia marisminoris TaxID=315423 RepID=A0A1Y5TPY0_9RHOB|nr:ABC transporter permease [Palleronia marisminoris]SFH47607.1 monosaccharide ABC transporter membrane protein, CUT2 family [Palleronia marisminoris]SLN68823.1 Ribose transport system permease protein RbsC [Palleronia marisminoris]